ncbi:sialate O-acetylesterase [Novosphingobium beihaiensis]|uniref:Sialate O-acetylesterase domain-containing protein n=1 Tax=Novosphingobium beihaiensis TaxID=2930389 RepID=A0ABT0BRC6_9SPHN|nr:sialate O-acetylesterase [Novosphingobium beihaiensis]MCJ2187199.1 hypothetical protein [Novosphingobium beihaiensis]
MIRTRILPVLGLLAAGVSQTAMARPVFDPVFTSHMVLQRDRAVPVRGTAEPRAEVTVAYEGHSLSTRTDAQGRWAVELPSSPAGAPFSLSASDASGKTVLDDVVFGDVWLCSGQSNMEFTLRHVTNADLEVASAGHADLRLFNMPRQSSTRPQAKPGQPVSWQRSAPQSAADFSAACYFMGRDLQQHLKVPIGLIASSWGGSVIEEWLDRETLSKVPRYRRDLAVLDAYAHDHVEGMAEWDRQLQQSLGTRAEPPADAVWKPLPSLSVWENWGGDTAHFDGIGYYRGHVRLTAAQAEAGGTLKLGPIDDIDVTHINGRTIGAGQGWDQPRAYAVPQRTLHAGDNLVEITAIDIGGGGGLSGPAPALALADGTSVPLTALEFTRGAPLAETGMPPTMPWVGGSGRTTLFNGMIAPLGDFPVRGFAWYQGEANVTDPEGYRQLLPLLANQWRQRFGGKAFVMVQLANYGPLSSKPRDNDWGRFRDAQRLIAKADPMTGLASAVDIGQPGDIHPTDKQDVGKRLALEARRLAYGETVVSRGPAPLDARRTGAGITVRFKNGPLRAIGSDTVIGFQLCNAASQCHFATGRIDGTTIALPADPEAKTVRFLWAASPIVNLYNDAMLPATPFSLPIR